MRKRNTRHRDVAGYELEARAERAARLLHFGAAVRFTAGAEADTVDIVPATLEDIRDPELRQRVEARLRQMQRRAAR